MAKMTVSDQEILAQIPAARRRAQHALRTQPHASGVHYDRANRAIHLTLTNGVSLVVPVELVAALHHASDRDLTEVAVGAAGVSLRWDRLDVDLGVPGLAQAALGRHTLLRAAGAAGGAARTPAKARAARLNGRKGGRPRNPA
jgi:hypothetical protein